MGVDVDEPRHAVEGPQVDDPRPGRHRPVGGAYRLNPIPPDDHHGIGHRATSLVQRREANGHRRGPGSRSPGHRQAQPEHERS
jgi:hypothetical protein